MTALTLAGLVLGYLVVAGLVLRVATWGREPIDVDEAVRLFWFAILWPFGAILCLGCGAWAVVRYGWRR